jgi:hypothetical protein
LDAIRAAAVAPSSVPAYSSAISLHQIGWLIQPHEAIQRSGSPQLTIDGLGCRRPSQGQACDPITALCPRLGGNARAVRTTGDAFDLPEVWFHTRGLELGYRLGDQLWAFVLSRSDGIFSAIRVRRNGGDDEQERPGAAFGRSQARRLSYRLTPDRLLGRVPSVIKTVAWGTQPLGSRAAGLLAGGVGAQRVSAG